MLKGMFWPLLCESEVTQVPEDLPVPNPLLGVMMRTVRHYNCVSEHDSHISLHIFIINKYLSPKTIKTNTLSIKY